MNPTTLNASIITTMGATIAGRGRLLDSDSSEPSAFWSFTNVKDVDVEERSILLVKVVDGLVVDRDVVSCCVVRVDKEWSTLLVKVVDNLLVEPDVVSCWVVGVGVTDEERSTVDIDKEGSGTVDQLRNSSI